MASVIAVAQQKGGAGKTTLAAQLATALRAEGSRVAVVDTDPQASLTAWMRVREHEARDAPDIRLSMVGGWRLSAELDRLDRDADFVIIDSPPHAQTDAKEVIRRSNLVVVPCQPSPLDVWASKPTMETAAKSGCDALVVLNRVPPRGKALDEAMEAIERQGYPVTEARMGNRQAFVNSMARGLGVVESEPKGAAAREVAELLAELRGRLTS